VFKELKEFFANAAMRVGNPFLSSFFLSWLVINYKITLVIFNNIDYENQIKIITAELNDTQSTIVYPLIYALFYTLALPFFDIIYTYFDSSINNLKEFIILRSKKIKPYSTKDAKKIFSDLQLQIKEKDDENVNQYTKLSSEIASLKIELIESNKKIDKANLLYFLRDQTNPFDIYNKNSRVFINENSPNKITDKINYEESIKSLQSKHPILIDCLMNLYNSQNTDNQQDFNLQNEIDFICNPSDNSSKETVEYVFDLLVSLNILSKQRKSPSSYYVSNIELLKKCIDLAK
jgi:hypothetical protein